MQWFNSDCETKQSFNGELIAKTQNTTGDEQNEFPVRVSVSYDVKEGLFSAKTTYVAFIKNITAEMKQKELLTSERQLTEDLICNILPKPIAKLKLQQDAKIIVNAHT